MRRDNGRPMATTSRPNGLLTMARRQACRCDCGMSCVLRAHRHWLRSTPGLQAHPGPSTEVPTASKTWGGGSPANT
eukprot:6926164-Lingulodinium_polyedra.AAC.1